MAPTLAARVRYANFLGQVGTRDANTVIGSPIHDHERLLRHVALDAKRPIARLAFHLLLVKVVLVRVVRGAEMTLQAQVIAFLMQFEAVHVMTIIAANIVRIHLALCEGPPHIVLLENLSVRVIDAFA